jgi:hypothetical protein
MIRALLAFALTAVLATAAHGAQPGIVVDYNEGYVRVALEGSYAGAQYLVYRSDGAQATFTPMGSDQTLCTGECYALDLRAEPGKTYFYRFDVYGPDQSFASYGPYAVTIPNPPLSVKVFPNPLRGEGAQVELVLPGARWADPVFVEARVLDARGRTVRMLGNGLVQRGSSRIGWDGRDANGNRLVPGAYFVRVSGALGTIVSRIVSL